MPEPSETPENPPPSDVADAPRSPRQMPLTPWTLVNLAGRPATPWPPTYTSGGSTRAPTRPRPKRKPGEPQPLGDLVQLYWLPLREYLSRRHRLSPDEAEEALQSFITDVVVAGKLVQRADKDRGKFRTLLLVALDRHLISQIRRSTAAKRGGNAQTRSYLDGDATAPHSDAAKAAEMLWARQVLMDACGRARQWCGRRDRYDLWIILERRIILPALDGLPRPSHAQLAEQLGLEGTPDEVAKTAVNLQTTAKRLLARCLREIVGEYAEADQIDEEIRELWATFASK